jgi:membrane peptidoglycan carboxypeptidase
MSSDDLTLQLGDFPEGWLDALVEVEDPNFYDHNGLDLKTPGCGRTTITQAVVRNLYFDEFTPGFDELRRGLIAFFVLDPKVPKDTQLLFYVNTVYLGRQEGRLVHGFDRGAEVYFGKEFEELDYDEYLALVAMVASPSTFHVLTFPDLNAVRVERIQTLLDGDYVPMDVMDIYYDRASEGTLPSGN